MKRILMLFSVLSASSASVGMDEQKYRIIHVGQVHCYWDNGLLSLNRKTCGFRYAYINAQGEKEIKEYSTSGRSGGTLRRCNEMQDRFEFHRIVELPLALPPEK